MSITAKEGLEEVSIGSLSVSIPPPYGNSASSSTVSLQQPQSPIHPLYHNRISSSPITSPRSTVSATRSSVQEVEEPQRRYSDSVSSVPLHHQPTAASVDYYFQDPAKTLVQLRSPGPSSPTAAQSTTTTVFQYRHPVSGSRSSASLPPSTIHHTQTPNFHSSFYNNHLFSQSAKEFSTGQVVSSSTSSRKSEPPPFPSQITRNSDQSQHAIMQHQQRNLKTPSPSPSSHHSSSASPKSANKTTAGGRRRNEREFMDSTTGDWFDDDHLLRTPSASASKPTTVNDGGGVVDHRISSLEKSFGERLNTSGSKEDEWVLVSESRQSRASTAVTSQSKLPDEDEDSRTAAHIMQLNSQIARIEKFHDAVSQPNVDLAHLSKISWNGIPEDFRATTWKLLMGYMPSNAERRLNTLERKRRDYRQYVSSAFGKDDAVLDQSIWHQISIDLPRTHPNVKLYQDDRVQKALARVLYCWSIRHPASGYVQGINDLSTPFFQVFLADFVRVKDVTVIDLDAVDDEVIDKVEADTFWCLSKLLDGIQDNYTHAQPGIMRQISKMKELIGRIDGQLAAHIEAENIDFIQFAFRWMNCLLMRELTMPSVIRMWDTYLAEGPDGFSNFHIYVCAAFLSKWSKEIVSKDFQDIMIFLQNLPTQDWSEKEIEILLSEAYMWKSLFNDSPSHLAQAEGSDKWSI